MHVYMHAQIKLHKINLCRFLIIIVLFNNIQQHKPQLKSQFHSPLVNSLE